MSRRKSGGAPPEGPHVDENEPTREDLAPVPPAPEESAAGLPVDEVDAEGGVEEARGLPEKHLRGLLEALVFASDKPLRTGELARLASAPVKEVRPILAELQKDYAERGIVLAEVAGGWSFRTAVPFAPFVRELASERPVRLTRAQVETLAIVAYRQPITRPEIDEIRGVDSGATLKLLLDRELVRILGKKDEPGRPILYGTTTSFLEFFSLKSLKDLPTLREFTELSDESRRVAEAELGGLPVDPVAPAGRAARDTTSAPPPENATGPGLADAGPDVHDTIVPPTLPGGGDDPGPDDEPEEPDADVDTVRG